MRRRTLLLAFAILGLCSSSHSAATPTVDQKADVPDGAIGNAIVAQTFTVGISGMLVGVDVATWVAGATDGPGTIMIVKTSAGVPDLSQQLAAVTLAHLPAVTGFQPTISFPPVRVTVGDVLAVAVVSSTEHQNWTLCNCAYAGGLAFARPNNPAFPWSAFPTLDLMFRTYVDVATQTPPTANAGDNQTVRPGAAVTLDGTGSFDDNTPTNQLVYSWSFVSKPGGSQATIAGAHTATPSFVPDLHGSYEIQLVVTDQDGLSSTPSSVTISDNPPPTADAGLDQVVFVNSIVQLSGSGADPDNDPLTYTWTLPVAPTGSSSQIFNPMLPNATLVPDRAGVYRVQLLVSDLLGPGEPDTSKITAITATGYPETQLQVISALIFGLPRSAVTNRGNQNALIQFLGNAVVALQSADIVEARHKVEEAISRVDGCALRGSPDGNGASRDWVTTCDAQGRVYPLLVDVLAAIAP
jgi:hypothetical protein